MRIDLIKLRLKNFMSIGNYWIEVDFDKGLHLIKGINEDTNDSNGVGKSTIYIDGLMFSLFGQVVRNINKPDIVNTINGSKCESEITFNIGDKTYKIERGIKPDKLLFYINNELQNEESKKSTSQLMIDKVLGSNFKTFLHLLIMSRSYSQPFCDMDVGDKRKVIEDVLSVGIFGKMRDYIKKDVDKDLNANLKISEREFESSTDTLKELESKHKTIVEKSKKFEKEKEDRISELKKSLDDIEIKIVEYQKALGKNKDLKKKVEGLKTHKTNIMTENNLLSVEVRKMNAEIKEKNEILGKLKKNPVCPLCNSKTSDDHIKDHISEMELKVTNLTEMILNNEKDIKKKSDLLKQITEKISSLENKITLSEKLALKLESMSEKKNDILKEIERVNLSKNDFDELLDTKSLEKKQKDLEEINKKLKELQKDRKYYDYIKNVLSDEGIKNYIIKTILPFWNNKVNTYLKELGANFTIEFNETLDSIVYSRGRDPLSYHSFSGGEKSRIDTSILMSIIDLSKLKNSLDINVMVLDELLDSSGLSAKGREMVINILKKKSSNEGKSVYVISHQDGLPNHLFDKEISLKLKHGFTYLNN